MLTYQLRNEINKILDALDESQTFIQVVENIYEAQQQTSSALIHNISKDASSGTLKSQYQRIRSCIQEVSHRELYASLETLQKCIKESFDSAFELDRHLKNLVDEIDSFSSVYDNFLSNPNYTNTARLGLVSQQLFVSIIATKQALRCVLSHLIEKEHEIPEGVKELSVYLPDSMDCKVFSEKLNSIYVIYHELCLLFDISEAESPLQIKKVESGSFFAELLGNNKIVNLMVDFLRLSASHFYHTYTKEGKIKALPTKLESANNVLDFVERLEKAGVDTNSMKDELEKTGHSIVRELNTLLIDQSEIVVNEKQIIIDKEKNLHLSEQTPKIGEIEKD